MRVESPGAAYRLPAVLACRHDGVLHSLCRSVRVGGTDDRRRVHSDDTVVSGGSTVSGAGGGSIDDWQSLERNWIRFVQPGTGDARIESVRVEHQRVS